MAHKALILALRKIMTDKIWSTLQYEPEECQIFGRIRTEMEKLRPSVRKFRKYEPEKCQIFGRIRTEMEKLRLSVRKFRRYEPEECQISGRIRTEMGNL